MTYKSNFREFTLQLMALSCLFRSASPRWEFCPVFLKGKDLRHAVQADAIPLHFTLHACTAKHSSGPGTNASLRQPLPREGQDAARTAGGTAGGTAVLPARRAQTLLCRCALEARPVLSRSFQVFPLERSARHGRAVKPGGQRSP